MSYRTNGERTAGEKPAARQTPAAPQEPKQHCLNSFIKWSKTYYKELGEKDQDGFYDYAYHCYIYIFYLPGGNSVRARRYTDEPNECSLFFFDILNEYVNNAITKKLDIVSAVINFLRATQDVSKFNIFNKGYKTIDLSKIKNNLSDFYFVEVIESS